LIKEILERNKFPLTLAFIIIFIGILIGANTPSVQQEILKEAKEQQATIRQLTPIQLFQAIFFNNAYIAISIWIGALTVTPLITLAIRAVGIVFGVVLSPMITHPYVSILVMASFGLLELISYIFATAAGILFLVAVAKLILRQGGITDALLDSGTLILLAIATLFISAILETILMSYHNVYISLLIGVSSTTIYLYILSRG